MHVRAAGACRPSEPSDERDGRDAFVQDLAKRAKAAAGPVSAEASRDSESAPAEEGDAEPAGGAGEEGEGEGAEKEPWPPVKDEEQTWEEYLQAYRKKCPAAEMIVKRDPVRQGQPSQSVQPAEFWSAQEEAEAARDADEAGKWEKWKEDREAAKAAREERVAKLKEEMQEKAKVRADKDFSAETEGGFLQRRQGLLARMEKAKAFVDTLAEKLTEIEMVSEEVEDAEPPAPAAVVKLDDQQLVEKLMRSIQGKAGDAALWAEVLAALRAREAGPLLEELEEDAQDVEVAAVVSYHYQRATDKWGAELKRITDANDAETARLKEEADAAAAEAAAAEDEA